MGLYLSYIHKYNGKIRIIEAKILLVPCPHSAYNYMNNHLEDRMKRANIDRVDN